MTQHHEAVKHVIDGGAAITVLGSIAGWLPTIAAGCAIIWYLIRFYEYYQTKRLSKTRKGTS